MLNIKSFNIIDTLIRSDMILNQLLQNNMRCECLYNKCIIDAEIVQSHEFDAFPRLLWESNYQMRDKEHNSYFDEDGSTFNIRLTLGECIDYIWKCTPPVYQKYLPLNINNVSNIYSMMYSFLFDDPRKSIYNEFFKEITQYGIFNKPMSFDSIGVDKLIQYSKDDKNICYVVSADKNIINLNENDIVDGVFMIRMLNKAHIREFNELINSNEYLLLDYKQTLNNGYYVTIKAETNKLNKMINDSYSPIINNK